MLHLVVSMRQETWLLTLVMVILVRFEESERTCRVDLGIIK